MGRVNAVKQWLDQTFVLSDGRHFTRSRGGILHPEREPLSVLNNIKNTIGNANFSARYLQQPVPTQKATWFGVSPVCLYGRMLVWASFALLKFKTDLHPGCLCFKIRQILFDLSQRTWRFCDIRVFKETRCAQRPQPPHPG